MTGRGSDLFRSLGIGRGRGGRGAGRSEERELGPPAPPQAERGQPARRGMVRDQRPLGFIYTRPQTVKDSKEGSSGKQVLLSANYFRLIKKPEFEFNLYRVDFKPDIELLNLRKRFIAEQKPLLGGYLFDGQNMLYLTRRLEQDTMEFECTSKEGVVHKMIIKNTKSKIEMTDGMATQVLNLILRRTMEGLKMQLVGRNMYDPNNKVDLKEFKVELWPGYITSIRQHEEEVLVCCEVSHKVMRQETIFEIIRRCLRDDKEGWKDNFKKEIIGSTVLTAYNNRTYRVDDVDFSSSPSTKFQKGDKEMTIKDYYWQKYELKIVDPSQPMLVSKAKASDIRGGRTEYVLLVPELCRATGLTDKMRADFRMMKDMAEHTQMDPEKRKKRLLDFTRRLHESQESVMQLQTFHTDIDKNLVTFKGRALEQEKIRFGNDKTAQNNDGVDWTNAMKQNSMFHSTPLKRWAFVYPPKAAKEAEEFLQILQDVARGMAYEVSDPKKLELSDDRTATYVDKLNEILTKDPKMVMIIVPNNAGDRYAAIKRLTCIDRTVPTQIIVHKTMIPKKGNMGAVRSIATKVMIQVNCKLGGAPWMIDFPLKGVMTIGYDVTHDTKDRSKAFGAFVASMDLKSTVQFYSNVSSHKDGNEMSTNIYLHLVQALKVYKNIHGVLPERIFFYRDGVGDGQIEYVHTQEVMKIVQRLDETYERLGNDQKPKFSFIIVNKRINTRIFMHRGSTMVNPNSGTVVDTTITLPERYDFYLVSQSVRQGTVAPTSYNVIYDTNDMAPDKMQKLTYKHTHLYFNWSGCTRVPAVVQYAHKLALLAGEHLHQTPSDGFENQLYFL